MDLQQALIQMTAAGILMRARGDRLSVASWAPLMNQQRAWMACFHGVATSYLPNYPGWLRALGRNARTGAKSASLLALALGA